MQPLPFSCICKKNQSIKISYEGGSGWKVMWERVNVI